MPLRRLSTRHTRFFTCRCQRCAAEPDTSRGLPCPACWGASPHARSAATGLLPGLLTAEDVATFGRDVKWDEPWARVALKEEGGRPELGFFPFDPPEEGARRWESHARLGFIYPDPMTDDEASPRVAASSASGSPASASSGAAQGGGPWACCTCGSRFANDDAVLYGGAAAASVLRETAAAVLSFPGVRERLPQVSEALLGLGSPEELADRIRRGELQVRPLTTD